MSEQVEADEPDTILVMDAQETEVRLDDDRDDGLSIVLREGSAGVLLALPRGADAGLTLKSIIRRLEALEPELQRRTIGYQHGPHTGPGAYR